MMLEFSLPTSLPDISTPRINVGPGTEVIAVGIAPLGDSSPGSLVVRVELAMMDDDGELVWFDAGTTSDLNATTRTRAITVLGYRAIRLAIRTAAGDAGRFIRCFIGN
jgi:hypothetical protein